MASNPPARIRRRTIPPRAIVHANQAEMLPSGPVIVEAADVAPPMDAPVPVPVAPDLVAPAAEPWTCWSCTVGPGVPEAPVPEGSVPEAPVPEKIESMNFVEQS